MMINQYNKIIIKKNNKINNNWKRMKFKNKLFNTNSQ